MPDFAYVARDTAGHRVTGTIAAGTEREVISQLAGKSLFPLQVSTNAPVSKSRKIKKIKPQLMATTYGQMASLLRSGVPLLRALAVLRGQTSHPGLKTVLEHLHDQVEEGTSMADAMARYPKVFSEMGTSMIRAGSEGGFLEEALERVADFTEKAQDLKSRTVGAMAYPIFLGGVGSLVVSGLMIFLVPKYEAIFSQLRAKGDLPAMTEALLTVSGVFQNWWWIVSAVVAVLVILVRARLQTEQGQLVRDRFKLWLPGAGAIFKNLAVARFCRVLGTLLHNGVPILRSLEISSAATGNRVLATAIKEAAENISSGETLAQPLKASGHFPATVVEMIAVAEESNTLDKVLIETADSLERHTWRQMDLLVRLLEPVMLLALASIVLCVAIALLLPMMRMATTVG